MHDVRLACTSRVPDTTPNRSRRLHSDSWACTLYGLQMDTSWATWAGRRAMTTSPTARERLGSVARHIDPLGTTLTFTLGAEGGRQEQGGALCKLRVKLQGQGKGLSYHGLPRDDRTLPGRWSSSGRRSSSGRPSSSGRAGRPRISIVTGTLVITASPSHDKLRPRTNSIPRRPGSS